MLFGLINVNKPKGFTSHQVVAKLRKILNIKQIGHTGTLDPMAVGVLPVCVGKATRLIQYLDTSKAYRAEILLGVKTDTYDIEGAIIEQKPVQPDRELVVKMLGEFKGEIIQTPPIYSAVHYKGKRLYEYARKNIEIPDIPQRQVTINEIKLVSFENTTLVVDIDCSGGTYIRSIAYDLGEKLGCGACLSGLTRTRSGKFRLEDSFTLEEIEEKDPTAFIIPPQEVLDFEIIQIGADETEEIKNGRYIKADRDYKDMVQLVYNDRLVSVAKQEDSKIRPVQVFITD